MWRVSCAFVAGAAAFSGDDSAALLQTNTQASSQNEALTFRDHLVEGFSFGKFVEQYGRTYVKGSEEWAEREAVFEGRRKELLAKRAKGYHEQGHQSWTAGVTKFMDFTDAEYKRLLGRKGPSKSSSHAASIELYNNRPAARPARAVPTAGAAMGDPRGAPAAAELKEFLAMTVGGDPLAHLVRDQGGCGSCWAAAATHVLESALEKNSKASKDLNTSLVSMGKGGFLTTLSLQTMVSCTPNPRHCGGSGGCDGAISEQGFDLAKDHGLPLATHLLYKSGNGNTGECPKDIFDHAGSRLFIEGYTVLPKNKFHPLKQALVEHGAAIVVSVDASNWQFYYNGIYTDTAVDPKGEFTVNHAVSLFGWHAPPAGYWLIKNSWGPEWGEKGFIRIEMKENEGEHCGIDYATHQGLACDGDPDQDEVCGTCGILYDSSFPYGLFVK